MLAPEWLVCQYTLIIAFQGFSSTLAKEGDKMARFEGEKKAGQGRSGREGRRLARGIRSS